MPIEIRELVIRAVSSSPATGSEQLREGEAAPDQREEIVRECVKQVMRILRKTRER
jgi:hypothetical protein